ncbi:MAG: hypothetical protein J0L87_11590 [Bacteroidetes bacterium]|nr:hypothetical protein [Bacteroidota bacterium]
MKEEVLKWLNIADLKILKQIIIISDRQNGEYEIGQVIYTRPLTVQYNLKKQEGESKTTTSIESLLQEYPRQKNYPNDRIDEIIFESIRKTFPKSILRNDTIFFNIDEEKLSLLRNKNIVKSAIYFSPEFSGILNVFEYVGRTFKAPRIDINIYSYYKSDLLDGRFFYANYSVTEENILEQLNTVKFE